MSRLTECAPCQMGEHDRHYSVVRAVPEGTMGGAICPCKGECVAHGMRLTDGVKAIRQMFAEPGPSPREVAETEYVAEAIFAAADGIVLCSEWEALTSYERDQWREVAAASIAAVRRLDRGVVPSRASREGNP